MIIILITFLCACTQQVSEENFIDMTSGTGDGYATIEWGKNTYVPYCTISKNDCGNQIGIVDGDKDDRVYEYNGYSTNEWIISMYVSGLMDSAMLYKEINVTDIPAGLQSEYEWNQ